MKRTPLFESHKKLGARLIEFGGWEMPVQYSSIVDEHLCVRKSSGVFDISHMGEVSVSGPGSSKFLNQLLTNDIEKLSVGQGHYTLMCNEQGGVIDDLYAYRIGGDQYLLIVNASRIEDDFAWIESQCAGRAGVVVANDSDRWGAVAVQGPRVVEFIDDCFAGAAIGGTSVAKPTELKKNELAQFDFDGSAVWVCRTGYTGEDGFEIVAPSGVIEAVWDRVLANGHVGCLQPCGLGARDTLRTEVCYPLYGHELTETITPVEAGVGFFVATDKRSFNGRDVLARQKQGKPSRRIVAFRMTGKSAPPRPHYPVILPGDGGRNIGEVTSGTQSPSLSAGIGLCLVEAEFAKTGGSIEIEIRGRRFPAEIVKKPIYRKPTS